MAKVTKSMLKDVVKECLVEILSEGLGVSETLNESLRKSKKTTRTKKKNKTIFDQLDEGLRSKHPTENTSFNRAVENAAKAATDDPMLQNILEETARTTLQDQLQHDPSMSNEYGSGLSGQSSATLTAGSAGLDIDSLFGESSAKWGEVFNAAESKTMA